MTLPELAIKRHVTTLMILVSLIVLGTVALVRLPLAFLPEMDEPEIYVRLPYPNSSPEQSLQMIVRPVEDILGSLNGLNSMYSRCDEDGGFINLEFDWGTDLHLARVEIWEKIDRVRRDLPDDMEEITVSSDYHSQETEDPVLEGRLSSELDLSEAYDVLDRKVVKRLQRVPGVGQVRLDGVNPREVHINLRLTDLELHNMDVRQVSAILRGSNFNQSLGIITEGDHRYTLRTVGTFASVKEIQDLVIRSDGLRLRNVADVVYEEPPLEFGRHLDGNFAVGITVSTEANANAVEVCKELEERISKMDGDPELKGVNFFVWFSEGKEIARTLSELFFTGVFGAILASVVLYVFLRRFLTTMIAVLCIPFSLIVTCGFVWAQGHTMNTMTLLGLIVGIGMLVDNAVVVIENIYRHQEMGQDRKTAARLGAREVSTAVIAATLTSVIVFLPTLFNKPSRMSIPLKEIGFTVCLTLLASLFISQTLIPMATSWFIRSRPRPREPWMLWLESRYVGLLKFNLHHRWITPLVGITVALSAVYPYSQVDKDLDQRKRSLRAEIDYRFSEDRSLEQKKVVVEQIEEILEAHREELMTKAIYSWWSDGPCMTRIYLKDGQATRENLDRVEQRVAELLPELPGIRFEIGRHHRPWHHGGGKDVVFRVSGEDPDVLAELAEEARRRLEQIDGLSKGYAKTRRGKEELHVEMDRDLIARYGVSPEQVASTIGLTFRGRRLQRFRTPDGEREMRLTLDEKETETFSQLQNMPAWTPAGERVPLAALASIKTVRGAKRIERNERLTSVWVGAKYEDGTREQYIPLVTDAMNAMEFPDGYSWSFGSWQSEREERSRELWVNLALALLLVFAVMSSLFESVQQALALMVALPFALSGAIWTLYLTGNDFDQSAVVGTLLLIGIVVNNGIVMIEHINAYRRRGMPREEAMLLGGRERLRPILMTALTTLIGLVPIVYQQPSLGGMSYYTMALVIMGGLTVSSFLTSILLPTTTTLVEDLFTWLGRILGRSGRSLNLDRELD